MICFSILTVGNLHCLPICPSITQSITRSYTGAWGSIYQSKHDTKLPPPSSRHLFQPSCPGAWSLPSLLLQSLWWLKSSHPRGRLENVLLPWTYQCHAANFLLFLSTLTNSRHNAQKIKDYSVQAGGLKLCSGPHGSSLSFVDIAHPSSVCLMQRKAPGTNSRAILIGGLSPPLISSTLRGKNIANCKASHK